MPVDSQTADKRPIAALLRAVHTLAYRQYASAVDDSCALHSNTSRRSVGMKAGASNAG